MAQPLPRGLRARLLCDQVPSPRRKRRLGKGYWPPALWGRLTPAPLHLALPQPRTRRGGLARHLEAVRGPPAERRRSDRSWRPPRSRRHMRRRNRWATSYPSDPPPVLLRPAPRVRATLLLARELSRPADPTPLLTQNGVGPPGASRFGARRPHSAHSSTGSRPTSRVEHRSPSPGSALFERRHRNSRGAPNGSAVSLPPVTASSSQSSTFGPGRMHPTWKGPPH